MTVSILAVIWFGAALVLLRWLRWNTRLPVPGRAQDVRKLMRQSVRQQIRAALVTLLGVALLGAATASAQQTYTDSGGTTYADGTFSVNVANITSPQGGYFSMQCPMVLQPPLPPWYTSSCTWTYTCNGTWLVQPFIGDVAGGAMNGTLCERKFRLNQYSAWKYNYVFTGSFPGGSITQYTATRSTRGAQSTVTSGSVTVP